MAKVTSVALMGAFLLCLFGLFMNAFAAVDPDAKCYIEIANGTCYYEPPAGYDCELGNAQDPTFRGWPPCDSTGICYVPLAGDEEVCYYTAPYGYDCYYKLIPDLIRNMTHCDLIKANSAPEITFLGTGVTSEDTDLLIDWVRIVDRDARENERDNKGYIRVQISSKDGKSKLSFQPTVLPLPADRQYLNDRLGVAADRGGIQFRDGSNGTIFSAMLDFQARMDPLQAVLKTLVFRPNLNVNNKNNGNKGLQVYVWVNDQGNTGGTEEKDDLTATITVNPVNDPPTVTVTPPFIARDEDTSRTLTGIVVADPDINENDATGATHLLSCTLTVTKGKIWVTRKLASGTGFVQTPSDNTIKGTTIVLTATMNEIQSTLNQLNYLPNPNVNDDSGVEKLKVVLNDNGNFDTPTLANPMTTTTFFDIRVTPVNDPPIVYAPSELVTDEDVLLPGSAFNITIDDVDTFANLEITLSVLYGTIPPAFSTKVGTLAEINALIASTSYKGNPDFNGYDTLTIRVDDRGPNGVTVKTVPIRVEAVNDPPEIWPDCPSVCLGGGYTGAVVMNSPGVYAVFDGSLDERPKFRILDVDAGTLDMEILLEAQTGVLKLNGATSGIRFVVPKVYDPANGHEVMWFMAPRSVINSVIDGLRYEGPKGSEIIIAVNDMQHTGKGKAETDLFELPIPV